jgi:hypothetical protein
MDCFGVYLMAATGLGVDIFDVEFIGMTSLDLGLISLILLRE